MILKVGNLNLYFVFVISLILCLGSIIVFTIWRGSFIFITFLRGYYINIYHVEMKDLFWLLPQLRHPNKAWGAQWFWFSSSEIVHFKKQDIFFVFNSLFRDAKETRAAPVVCPCNNFIVRVQRSCLTLNILAFFREPVCSPIYIGIEFLFVSYSLDNIPVCRLYFLINLINYNVLVQSHNIPIVYFWVVLKVKQSTVFEFFACFVLYYIFRLKFNTYYWNQIVWTSVLPS